MIYNIRKKITVAFILTGVVIVATLALRSWFYYGAEIRTPTFSPDGRFIVFSLEEDGAGLYRLPGYGGKMEQLLSPQPPKYAPSFFHDGRMIAFAEMAQGHKSSIFIANADGGDVKQVTSSNNYDYGPQPSSDGKKIFFIRSKEFNDRIGFWMESDIYSVNVDGTDLKNISNLNCTHITSISLSPNGKELVADMDCGAENKLWKLFINSSEKPSPIRLDFNNDGMGSLCSECSYPQFLPDGNSIVFIRPDRSSGPYVSDSIYVTNFATRQTRKLYTHSAYIIEPRVSNDGLKMVFISGKGANIGQRTYELWVVDLTNGSSQKVVLRWASYDHG